jgi:hypothetical protein
MISREKAKQIIADRFQWSNRSLDDCIDIIYDSEDTCATCAFRVDGYTLCEKFATNVKHDFSCKSHKEKDNT